MTEPEAETHSLDQHRDPTEAAVVRSLAAQVVAQHDGDLRGMRRALGISNATWVGGGLAVRIANTSVVDGMAAEVALVRALPPEVGHPKILGAGTIRGHDWIVTEGARGQNLREARPPLAPEERRRAVRQLWARARGRNDAGADAFAIAARERDPVHGRALLLGAAVLDQLRDLEIWLGRDRTEDRFEDWRPDRLLTGLLETDGGYLEPALT